MKIKLICCSFEDPEVDMGRFGKLESERTRRFNTDADRV